MPVKSKKVKPIKKWYKKKRKNKFKKPAAGMKSRFRSRIVNPYGVITHHRGMVYDKLRHVVLSINQMSEVNKRFVQATLKTVTTGPQACTMPDGKNGWACMSLDDRARTYVLSYRGIEVALFYQRQLTEIRLQPGDRYPEGVCQDPKEAWMRLDFLGLSAEKANFVLTSQHKRLEEENKLLKDRLQTVDQLNEGLEKENTELRAQLSRKKKRKR